MKSVLGLELLKSMWAKLLQTSWILISHQFRNKKKVTQLGHFIEKMCE